MMFMGTETHQDGWWNADQSHGFDWTLVQDPLAQQMMALVSAPPFRERPLLRPPRNTPTLFSAQQPYGVGFQVRAANLLRRGLPDLSSETEAPRFPHVDAHNRVLGTDRMHYHTQATAPPEASH